MSEVSTIVCPNCGASTINTHNCEYCGSALIRFTLNGIPIDSSKYGESAKAIPGLEDELKNNLKIQEVCNNEQFVITNISIDGEFTRAQIIQTSACNVGLTDSNPFSNTANGDITLRLPFAVRSSDKKVAIAALQSLHYFENMDSFPLFTSQQYEKGIVFFLDLGKDTLLAAQIITQVFNEADYSNSAFDFLTTIVSKDAFIVENSGRINMKDIKYSNALYIIGGVITLVIFLLLVLLD